MKLFNKKIKVGNEELWVKVNKWFKYSGQIDYYTYECNFYKEIKIFFMTIKKRVYSYETYWLNYEEYHGNIDRVIDEAINNYQRNLREQKYISENESGFKSKYEV